MNQKQLRKAIDSGKLQKLYIFCGDDYYLKKLYIDRIAQKTQYPVERVDIEEPEELPQLVERVSLPPLFSNRNRIVLARLHFPLKQFQVEINVKSGILIVDPVECGNIDAEGVVKFERPVKDEIEKFILIKLRRCSKRINAEALAAIVESYNGKSASVLDLFLENLVAFCGDRTLISYDDVAVLLNEMPESNAFRLVLAILNRSKETLKIADEVLANVHPSAIVTMLTNELQRYVSYTHGVQINLNPSARYRMERYALSLTPQRVKSLLAILRNIDAGLKGYASSSATILFKSALLVWLQE